MESIKGNVEGDVENFCFHPDISYTMPGKDFCYKYYFISFFHKNEVKINLVTNKSTEKNVKVHDGE